MDQATRRKQNELVGEDVGLCKALQTLQTFSYPVLMVLQSW